MNRELQSAPKTSGDMQRTPEEKIKYAKMSEHMQTPLGMFDQNLRMSTEMNVHGGQQTQSPTIRKHATFGEGQIDMQAMLGSREE